MQEVSIGTRSCRNTGNAAHELGHALGFWHEHTRPDRDTYIHILTDNIIPQYRYNFHRSEHSGVPDVGYDFQSIMHYSQTAFNNGNGKTIVPVRTLPDCIGKIGQRRVLSYLDAMRMNRLYNCSGE